MYVCMFVYRILINVNQSCKSLCSYLSLSLSFSSCNQLNRLHSQHAVSVSLHPIRLCLCFCCRQSKNPKVQWDFIGRNKSKWIQSMEIGKSVSIEIQFIYLFMYRLSLSPQNATEISKNANPKINKNIQIELKSAKEKLPGNWLWHKANTCSQSVPSKVNAFSAQNSINRIWFCRNAVKSN